MITTEHLNIHKNILINI